MPKMICRPVDWTIGFMKRPESWARVLIMCGHARVVTPGIYVLRTGNAVQAQV